MADVYRRWSAQGSRPRVLLYVRVAMAALCPARPLPAGRRFSARDHDLETGPPLKTAAFFSLFESPVAYKTPVLDDLVQKFPQRTFILVGDAGGKDPEIYGAFARQYPQHVEHIYIRQLNAGETPERFARAFAGVPLVTNVWSLFRTAGELHATSPEKSALDVHVHLGRAARMVRTAATCRNACAAASRCACWRGGSVFRGG